MIKDEALLSVLPLVLKKIDTDLEVYNGEKLIWNSVNLRVSQEYQSY